MMAGKKKISPDDKRGTNARSLANLEGHKRQPGESGNPSGINHRQPYSEAMRAMAGEPVREPLRGMMNCQLRAVVQRWIRRSDLLELGLRELPDFHPPGVTWARANALRRHLRAVIGGDIRDAIEIREAVEGRATQRIEVAEGEAP